MNKTRYATYAAITAALYAAITLATSFMAFGPIQFRVAEAMCVLPAYTTASIPGLFISSSLAPSSKVRKYDRKSVFLL